ncbi:MAG TPA: hypothetical protein VKA94_03900 [Hyphomicrobiales bacterium]|nr:hypothetical protein [Hyphomicrobiales bacterium]
MSRHAVSRQDSNRNKKERTNKNAAQTPAVNQPFPPKSFIYLSPPETVRSHCVANHAFCIAHTFSGRNYVYLIFKLTAKMMLRYPKPFPFCHKTIALAII